MLLLDLEFRTTCYCTYIEYTCIVCSCCIICIYNKYWVVRNTESLKNKCAQTLLVNKVNKVVINNICALQLPIYFQIKYTLYT